MIERPIRITRHEQRISATRSITVERVAYTDTILIDAMHETGELSDDQHRAACRLYGLFLAAGLLPWVTPRHDGTPSEDDQASAAVPTEEALLVYRRMLREAGQIQGPILDALMQGTHPGRRISTARDALDDLARGWGMG